MENCVGIISIILCILIIILLVCIICGWIAIPARKKEGMKNSIPIDSSTQFNIKTTVQCTKNALDGVISTYNTDNNAQMLSKIGVSIEPFKHQQKVCS